MNMAEVTDIEMIDISRNEGGISLDDNVLKHQLICEKIHNTYIAKNNDYGNSFSKSFDEYGMIAAIVRMEDKMGRLKSLTINNNKQMVNDESVKDTLIDLASYAIMTAMELDKHKEI